MIPKPKRKASRRSQPTIKSLDRLLHDVIVARAKGKSELTGRPSDIFHVHHIMHKPNRRLRYDLKNCIALTPGEHRWGVHGKNPEKWRDMLRDKLGEKTWKELELLRLTSSKVDLSAIEAYLKMKLWEFENNMPQSL